MKCKSCKGEMRLTKEDIYVCDKCHTVEIKPPTLGVSVKDELKTEERFGG